MVLFYKISLHHIQLLSWSSEGHVRCCERVCNDAAKENDQMSPWGCTKLFPIIGRYGQHSLVTVENVGQDQSMLLLVKAVYWVLIWISQCILLNLADNIVFQKFRTAFMVWEANQTIFSMILSSLFSWVVSNCHVAFALVCRYKTLLTFKLLPCRYRQAKKKKSILRSFNPCRDDQEVACCASVHYVSLNQWMIGNIAEWRQSWVLPTWSFCDMSLWWAKLMPSWHGPSLHGFAKLMPWQHGFYLIYALGAWVCKAYIWLMPIFDLYIFDLCLRCMGLQFFSSAACAFVAWVRVIHIWR